MTTRTRSLKFRKAQIKRWLDYRLWKECDALIPPHQNPYSVFIQKLMGKESTRPRLKSVVNAWRKTACEEIKEELQAIIPSVKTAYHATTCDEIACQRFAELDIREQGKWRKVVEEEHKMAMVLFNKEMEAEPSTNPEERQRSIQGLVKFMQPVLDTISKATGWKASLIAGGPEPAQDGALNIISMHSGLTSGAVGVNFGILERSRYKKAIVPIFGSFLQKCYTPAECKSRALPKGLDHFSLSSSFDFHESIATMHTLDPSQGASNVTSTAASDSIPPVLTACPLPNPLVASTANVSATRKFSDPAHDTPLDKNIDNSNPFPYQFDDDLDENFQSGWNSQPGSQCVSPTPSIAPQSPPASPARIYPNIQAISVSMDQTPQSVAFATPRSLVGSTPQIGLQHGWIQPPQGHPPALDALVLGTQLHPPMQPPQTPHPSIQYPMQVSHPSIQAFPPRSTHPSVQPVPPGLTHTSIQPRSSHSSIQPPTPSLCPNPLGQFQRPQPLDTPLPVPTQSLEQPTLPGPLRIRIPISKAAGTSSSLAGKESGRGSKRVPKKSEKVVEAELRKEAKDKAEKEKAEKAKKKPVSKAKAPIKAATSAAEKESEPKKKGKRAAVKDADLQETPRPGKRIRVTKVRT